MKTLRELKELYKQGKNITQVLRKEYGFQQNTDEIIEIAYDLQTGSYISAMKNTEMQKHKIEYTSEIARIISSLCKPDSILEAGVGEATTLSGVLQNIDYNIPSYGFDLCWSRVAFARRWLLDQGFNSTTLCVGSLFHIPFTDDSIDVVYTSHSIEPNGGNEEVIIKELLRITKRFLILLEPAYELTNSPQAKKRMENHGYCKNLRDSAEKLGYSVLTHRLFPYTSNPLNPTAITIIEKTVNSKSNPHILACPKTKTPLREIGGQLFNPESLTVYPVIAGIPCLRVENGILASKYEDVVEGINKFS